MRWMWKGALLTGAIGLAAGGAVGCAAERPPINRVQADALAKSFYVGDDLRDTSDDPEFYMRNTVIDVGYGAAQDGLFTSTYAQPVSRIRWEISEDHLIARLAYERIQGTDAKGDKFDGLRKKGSNDGQIVASYRIKSHFDIRRAYNPATGEESNIIEENASDRPWDQRAYMRVDWSQNEATGAYDFDTLSMMGLFGGVKYSPLAYTILESNDGKHAVNPDAPHFDAEKGYFDVTNKAYAEPQSIDLSGLGWGIQSFPACMLPGDFAGGTEPYGNCNPVEITLRQSFKKVVDTDYEPMHVDGPRFQAYGNFTTAYYGYERNYGMVDDKWFRFADRYNLWKRSHFYTDAENMTGEIACDVRDTAAGSTQDPTADPNRDANGNGTADECEGAGLGSQCDVFKGKCTLPYAKREATVIPWYVNGGTTDEITNLSSQIEGEQKKGGSANKAKIDALQKQILAAQQKGENLFEATDWAVQEWDLALKTSIQTARLVECKRTSAPAEVAGCATKFPMWTGQQDDIDEAIAIARELNACRRQKGWADASCAADAKAAAGALPEQVGQANKAAIGEVVAMPTVLVLCHNPVIKGDHAACGKEGLTARLGDLRYNTVLSIEKPQQPSAWGIMVDADDPISGEKVVSSINIWTHITDIAAQGLVDLVRYMNGELSTDQITNGEYVRDWVRAQRVAPGAAGGGPTLSKDEITTRLAAAAKIDPQKFAELTKGGVPAAMRPIIEKGKAMLADVATRADVASPSQAGVLARMSKVRGTETEAKLINPAMLQLAGITSSTPLRGAVADIASPMGMNNPKVLSQLRQMRENALAARGACIINEAPEASALTGIADIMKKKFPVPPNETGVARQARLDRMLNYVRRRYHYAVLAHEMGHSIGLRHNFVSTYASLFYRPQYWQLRTKNGTLKTECTDAVDDGNKCVGPRYFDPVTDEEQSQMIWQYMQSTVMDYPGDVSQDLIGLGVYDFGATRFFYGDSVSVYDASLGKDYQASGKIGTGITSATDTFGGLAGITYGVRPSDINSQGVDEFHYAQLQKNYNLIKNCYAVDVKPPASWRDDVDGIWDPVMDGHVVSVDGKATKCRQLPVDYAGWNQLRMPNKKFDKGVLIDDKYKTETNGGGYRGGPSVLDDPRDQAAPKLLRVPYAFATDHWADSGNVSVFRHDNGADPYEQLMFLITTKENRHIFDNFRRRRTTFSVRGAADRSFSRYNEKMLGISGGIGFYGTIYQDLATNQGYSFDTLWPLIVDGSLKGNIIAATVAFDQFTRELSRPEPGEHYYKSPIYLDKVLHSASDTDDYGPTSNGNSKVLVSIPNGATGYLRDISFAGHPLENGLAEDQGDYNSSYTMYAGSYYEKINTAILLSESEDRFISQSRRDFYDARFRAVGMADVLPDGYRRLLANALTGDRTLLAPYVQATPDKVLAGNKPATDTSAPDAASKLYPKSPIGWTSWWPSTGPKVCFPSNGKNICTSFISPSSSEFKPETKFPDGTTIDADHTAMLDPEIGWEVQKFLVAWTMVYIPANQKTLWTDMMRIYRLEAGTQPEFEGRIEWQDPVSGNVYYAKTYGMECLFGGSNATNRPTCEAGSGKWVQKGIGARVLEYANFLTKNGYALDQAQKNTEYGIGFNAYGRAVALRFVDGTSVIKPDPAIKDLNATGTGFVDVQPCNPDPTSGVPINGCKPLTTYKNHWAYQLTNYKTVPDYLHEFGQLFFANGHVLGQYP
jgi:hypothetical protein